MSNTVIGTQGAQGADGLQGIQGAQGKTGVQGAQGAQGKIGRKGAQGPNGRKGDQGDAGVQGVQGIQGIRGKEGPQGTRGCDGPQGASGMNGLQGAQGAKGQKGVQGTRGCDGVQGPNGMIGVQGPQGVKGPKGIQGTMGYQGDTGEVGIQGLVGPDGAIWDDGIRLSGYNTHLFEYNVYLGKYVAKNKKTDSIGNEVSADILYLKDGSVIRIWLNENAYTSLKDTNNIKIDSTYPRLGHSTTETTEYPVYYTDGVYFSEIINPDTDIDTIVEFTYSNNAWFYSGGLITQTITDEIEVSGVSLGNLTDGDKIPTGTTIQQLFELMFKKEINPKIGSLPKAVISFVNGHNIVEIGSHFHDSIEYVYTDGYFESSDKQNYPDSKFNVINGCTDGKLIAGCEVDNIKYTLNGIELESATIDIPSVSETSYVYSANLTYTDSVSVPKTNLGNDSEIKIDGSIFKTNDIKVYGRYMIYYGHNDKLYESNYTTKIYFTDQTKIQAALDDGRIESGWLNITDTTIIETLTSTEDNPSLVIIVPTNCQITYSENAQGQAQDISSTWYRQTSIDYTTGDIHTTYDVYISPSTEQITYKNITITRG